jgi:hypothetical protein
MKTTTRSLITRILKWTAVLFVLVSISILFGFLVSGMDSFWNENLNKQKLFTSLSFSFFVSLLIIMWFACKFEENYWETASSVVSSFCFNIPTGIIFGILGMFMAYMSQVVWWQKPIVFVFGTVISMLFWYAVLLIHGFIAHMTQKLWSKIFDWIRGHSLGPLPVTISLSS